MFEASKLAATAHSERAGGCKSYENLCTPELEKQKARKADFTANLPQQFLSLKEAPLNHLLMLKESDNK